MPNILFGSFGLRHSTHLFFPLLEADDRNKNNHLTDKELADFYNLAVRPTAARVLNRSYHNWPASFAAAQTKDRIAHGGFANSSYLIKGDLLLRFSKEIRRQVDNHDKLRWARYLFWGMEICGSKDLTHHQITAVRGRRARKTLRQIAFNSAEEQLMPNMSLA